MSSSLCEQVYQRTAGGLSGPTLTLDIKQYLAHQRRLSMIKRISLPYIAVTAGVAQGRQRARVVQGDLVNVLRHAHTMTSTVHDERSISHR